MKKGYESWVKTQAREFAERAREFNIDKQKEVLTCVSHPPSLPRVVLGEQYMDRFGNPHAYPRVVQEIEAQKPLSKVLSVLRVLQRAKHDEITRYVDPRGFDKADATARVQHGFIYGPRQDAWQRAIDRALAVFDKVVSDDVLTSDSSPVFDSVIAALNVDPALPVGVPVESWAAVPMEDVTKHLIERLEAVQKTAPAEQQEIVAAKLQLRWSLHEIQLEKERQVFEGPGEDLSKLLKDLLVKAAKEPSTK
jgi:hypothetical protein